MLSQHNLAISVGILGNCISFMVFLAPVPTFYRVYKNKSTEEFHSLPYVIALFSCMLWIYYALVKTNCVLLITINSFGLLIETIYISIYLAYAPMEAKKFTARILVLLNFTTFGMILLSTLLFVHGHKRLMVLGFICDFFSVSVFVAPLSIIRMVIRTKSVELMPVNLSFFLTISAAVWLGYGTLTKDIYVALPNVLGLLFGIIQMVLYCIYKDDRSNPVDPTHNEMVVPEIALEVSDDASAGHCCTRVVIQREI
ncbi:bidirectional sugar transporter SWEET14-like [Phalaenopsis equestris]|uniref:bidirectional sugar transporter SWEET14-like n=1 Tax=Phalaenopsis equestris TaxID=78828 RepID=UPI0009E5A803|nr:bidirectional sugar transporter SWEET14-like [Phalaenopsis equestris]